VARLALIAALAVFAACGTASAGECRLVVDVSDQALYLYDGAALVKRYPVSTSKYGTGNKQGSFQTPLGRHRVKKKIGAGAPSGTIFKNRVNTRAVAVIERTSRGAPEDFVTSRILWLEGLEPGKNRGRLIDSFKRFIYIHGTASEGLIGRTASNGCVRMTNRDVIDLYDRVPPGAKVDIRA
jgi:lipoprotein-anchoring transpeptidase ErfK/SrfK